MLEINNLSKRFDNLTVLDNVSLKIEESGIVGLIGPNGAGKTTLMRIIIGFVKSDSGEVSIFGKPVGSGNNFRIKKDIGYLPENNPLYEEMTVKSFLNFIASLRGIDRTKIQKLIAEVSQKTGLEDVLKRTIYKLSKGYKQRVGIAQAIIGAPKILILDEPASGLDPIQIVEVRNLIKSLGKERIVLLSSHILQEASLLCDRILIINRGKIISDFTREEFKRYLLKERRYETLLQGRKEDIIRILKQIEGITRINILTRASDIFKVTLSARKDVRKRITREIIKSGIEMLEFRSLYATLEEIFIESVKGGNYSGY